MNKKLLLIFGIVLVGLIIILKFEFLSPSQISLSTTGVSRTEAQLKVQSLPEVQQYIADLAKAGSRANLNVEDGGDTWNVQVFEVVKQGADSHTATFNWYRVDKKTSAITSEFDLESKQ